jgi:phage baseplate assembly protein W
MEESTFLGRGWSFPPTFSKSNKQLLLVSEENDIKESLHILLSTVPGERIMQPEFGCNLRSLVFENFSLSVQTMAKEMIRRAILFFESRVSVNSIDFNVEEIHNGYLQILINYTVRSTNTRFNMVYPFYLREGTGINLT